MRGTAGPGGGLEGAGEIAFGREVCGRLEEAERREWWLADGLGGYAAGTVAGTLTRRYHGLLIAPVELPLGRRLLAAKADAVLLVDEGEGEREWSLHTNRWASGAVNPQGFLHLESFRLEGRTPVWRYALGGFRVEARIWMERGAHATWLAWRLEEPAPPVRRARLRVRILVNDRDHHAEMVSGGITPDVHSERQEPRVGLGGGVLRVIPFGGTVAACRDWIEGFDLPVERGRGLPDRDNHLCTGIARLELAPGVWAGLALRFGEGPCPALDEALARARAADAAVLERAKRDVPELRDAPDWVRRLTLAADSFLFERQGAGGGLSVIAGYPWFGDWGRDTMIALPGLCLATGRHEEARRILETFAGFVDRGMLPNVFPGAGRAPEYNTVDAALWFVEAWRAYAEETGDLDAVRAVFPLLGEVLETYRGGTRFGIREDPADGLLLAGEPGVQLSWMDAVVGDRVITPRIGKPVEVNALWYNAHRAAAELARRIGQPDGIWRERAERIREGFRRFRDPDSGGLLDVLDGPGGGDASLRPNQILAASLPASPLGRQDQSAVVALCRRHLLTSFGLRSLAPGHPDYRGRYQGGVWERDSAYHQGTVWAWLLGHYTLAEYQVTGDAIGAKRLLEPLGLHLADAGLGTVSEIFDGDPPHEPRGCPAQAWSVACTLEAWWKLERAKGTKTQERKEVS